MSQVKVLITDDRGSGESVSSVSAQPVNTTINNLDLGFN